MIINFVGKDGESELWRFINWTVFGKGNIQRVFEEYLTIWEKSFLKL